ncbi:hypothetical protein [Paenibacillus sp. D2_2]|uniref:GAP1-M domain-containing protein n=1 Tax=Paenibacillus sp. D2_2 TaxID=3073092 RepID=UPI0035C0C93F
MTSVGEGRKKVYVALDVPAEQISLYSVALLKVLFACLPFELRRRFGFITYAKEPQSRKFIHLQFVERGSLRPNDRGIEKEYVFDLASGRLPQDEVDEGKQPYLDFVWNAIGELDVWRTSIALPMRCLQVWTLSAGPYYLAIMNCACSIRLKRNDGICMKNIR